MVYTPPPQTYIQLSNDGYLTLDSCQTISPVVNRGIQFNIGGIPQLYIPANSSIPGNGVGVLGVDNNGGIFWTSGSGGGGPPSGAAGGDLSGTYPNPSVNSLTGSSGTILIASSGNVITWNNATTSPGLNQSSLASTSGGSGSAGQNLTLTSQAGQNATGAAHNGGAGGSVVLSSGIGGTSGSATAGAPGNIIAAIAASALTTEQGFFEVKSGSNVVAALGPMHSFPTSDTALYMSSGSGSSIVPSGTNVVIDSFGSGVYFCDGARGTAALALSDGSGGLFTLNNTGAIDVATLSAGFNLGIQGMTIANYGGTVGCIGIPNVTTTPTGAVTGSIIYTESDGYFSVVPNGASAPTFKVSSTDVQITTNTTNLDLFNPTNGAAGGVGVINLGPAHTNPSVSVSNSAQIYLGSAGAAVNISPPNVTSAPFFVNSNGTFSTSGYNLFVNANSAGSTNMVGGILLSKASTNPTNSITNSTIFADSSTGAISFSPPSTTAASATITNANFNLNAINVLWTSGSGNSSIGFANLATNNTTGANLTITAQNETGTTSTGGNLIISSGSGTTVDGYVEIQGGGTTLFQYGVAGQQITSAAQTMANGANVLTAAKYQNGLIICSGTITGATTLVFPNTIGFWYVDISAMSGISATNTFSVQSGTKSIVALAAALTASTGLIVVSTRGSNSIACLA